MEADPATQTYAATFIMPAPDDVTLLPGMTATVTEHRKRTDQADDSGYAVPLDVVPIDGSGQYFVWSVKESVEGELTVHRVDVKVNKLTRDSILVTQGLSRGDRIAAAGVHLLQEGQQVRLLKPTGGDAAL